MPMNKFSILICMALAPLAAERVSAEEVQPRTTQGSDLSLSENAAFREAYTQLSKAIESARYSIRDFEARLARGPEDFNRSNWLELVANDKECIPQYEQAKKDLDEYVKTRSESLFNKIFPFLHQEGRTDFRCRRAAQSVNGNSVLLAYLAGIQAASKMSGGAETSCRSEVARLKQRLNQEKNPRISAEMKKMLEEVIKNVESESVESRAATAK